MAPKSKPAAPANGAIKKSKSATPSGTASPAISSVDVPAEAPKDTTYGSGKPDKALYDAEQNKIKAEIDALQTKLNAVKERIGSTSKNGPGADRRAALRAELDALRGQQSNNKNSRGRVIEQLKNIQDGIQKKVKDLNAAKAKIPYKTVAELDDRIRQLEKQVESGSLKLVEEKRALQEISSCKRSRRTVEGFEAEQASIEADRAQADEIRKQLDDPEAKAASERYDAIKAELDELKKESDEAWSGRSKLLDERTALQGQLDELYNQKRDSAQRFREANDRFYVKLNEDRARRAERQRAQRAADEEAKKKEIVERLREEADVPAFQVQIEDCQTLIEHFSGKPTGAALSTENALPEKAAVAGVPKLEIRQVSSEGLVVRKKKGEDEESYFVGGGKAKKGKKGGAKPAAPAASDSAPAEPAAASGQLNVPFATLSALLSLSIPPPTSQADVPRVVEDLKTKKAWFAANQARVTAETKAKAEAEIKRLLGKSADGSASASAPSDDVSPPNGGGEKPSEPAPTPAITTGAPSVPVPSDTVAEKLDSVEEQAVEAS